MKGRVPRTRRVEGWGGGKDLNLNRVFEREKRVASVHRRKSERCLVLFLCTVNGKEGESEKALWKRAKHKECGDVGGALGGGPHTTKTSTMRMDTSLVVE